MTKEEKSKALVLQEMNFDIVDFGINEETLTKFEKDFALDKMPTDLTVKENYEQVTTAISTIRKTRTGSENYKKDLKAPLLKVTRSLDGTWNQIKNRLLALETPLKALKSAQDEAVELARREEARREEERVNKINTAIDEIRQLVPDSINCTAAELEAILGLLTLKAPEDWAEEFLPAALAATQATAEALGTLLEKAKAWEQAEVDKKAEAEAREAEEAKTFAEKEALEAKIAADKKAEETARLIQRAAEDKKLAEEKAALDAEKEKLEKEKEALADAVLEADKKQALIDKAEADKIAAEEKKAADERAAALAEKARAAKEKRDAELYTQRTNTAVAEMEAYCATGAVEASDVLAKVLVTAIQQGKIPHIKWVN